MLLLALLLQATQVRVTATVDRDRVPVGEDVVYSLRVVTAAPGAFRVETPTLTGLEVADRTERIDDVAGSTRGERAFELDITFRASDVGTWRIAPVMVFVGGVAEAAPEVTVTVTGTASLDPGRNPLLVDLIRRVPPPDPTSNATLAIVTSADRVYRGDQLDVLTAAWFPRSLRARLRRPPTLKPPVLSGVWGVPQPAIAGIVASRVAGEETYDLFVSHQVAFPLTPGALVIPPARLEYAVPLSRRASGDERPVEAASEPATVTVIPAPPAPGGARGAEGRGLTVGYRLRSLPGYAGEVLPVEIAVTGDGNLAFWAPPNVTWPSGTRAYLDRTVEAPRTSLGRLGGAKTFVFLLLPDSTGSVALPPLRYDYFDPSRGQFLVAESQGVVVPVLPSRGTGPNRLPPPLVTATPDWATWSTRLIPGQPLWWVLVLFPLGGLGAVLGWRWIRARRPNVAPAARPDGLPALEAVVGQLVPEAERGHPKRIEGGLRRAGVPTATARDVTDLQQRIEAVQFSPDHPADDGSLGARVRAVLTQLPSRLLKRVGLAMLLLAAPGWGQDGTSNPEAQYRARAYGPAAAGFRTRAIGAPSQWQHWHDLAAALYLDGKDGAAAAAAFRARELAPRAGPVTSLWEGLRRQYEPLRVVGAPYLSRAEWSVVGLAAWWAGCLLLLWRRVHRTTAIAVLLGAAAMLTAQLRWRPWRPDGFLTAGVSLRRAPHGLGAESGTLGGLTAVTAEDRRPGWILVQDHQGNRGWVAASLVVPTDPERAP